MKFLHSMGEERQTDMACGMQESCEFFSFKHHYNYVCNTTCDLFLIRLYGICNFYVNNLINPSLRGICHSLFFPFFPLTMPV